MGVRAVDVYQGSDWTTHRWPVAHALETLDRIQDLCLCRTWSETEAPETLSTPELAEVTEGIASLCHDLAAELALVEADLLTHVRNNLPQRWLAFEMRLHLADMQRETAIELPAFESILLLATRIKDGLKQLDRG